MKGIRFAVWNWWCKPICILGFSQYSLLNVHHLSDSIYVWNSCNQAQFLNKEIIMECLAIKIFAWNFYNSQFKKYNSTHSYNRKSKLTFVLIFCSYVVSDVLILLFLGFDGIARAYSRKIKRLGIGRFVKNALFEKK